MHKARAFFFVCAGLLALVLLLPRTAAAAWPTDPIVNVPICTESSRQGDPTSVSDGMGGAIVTWEDGRLSDGYGDIYAQRISASGTVQWTADGVALCTAPGYQYNPTITSDGAGGAIVTWTDDGTGGANGDVYAQRISADGTVQWTANGVALCTAVSEQYNPTIVSDGAGGAIATWQDTRSDRGDIYAQRISAAGTVQWTTNGVALCTAIEIQYDPSIVSDGSGGAIVTWTDNRSLGYMDVYAQRISAGGAVQWMPNGVALCPDTHSQYSPTIVLDGAGGAIVTWLDGRIGNLGSDIYAQRISAAGAPQWATNGVALCTAAGNQTSPEIISDGEGGAIVTWYDGDIYAQRISAAGAPQWATNGVALCTAAGSQQWTQSPDGTGEPVIIVSDGGGGAIVTWVDYRSGNWDIYAQRVLAGGTVRWTPNGVAVCTDPGTQQSPAIIADGAGGAIVSWMDLRSGNWDIYAQKVNADGTLGGDVPTPVLLSLVSADVGADFITLTWFAGGSESDVATVYRSAAGGAWTRIGEVTADGTGYLRYTDPIEAGATRVGYRLGIVDAGIEGFYGETWVDLPAGKAPLVFALDPVRPNPSRGGALTVHFSLPTDAPARLELLDVAGRRIASHAVSAGQHTLDLGAGQHLAPGLYLVRLTQGANTRTTRVAVLR